LGSVYQAVQSAVDMLSKRVLASQTFHQGSQIFFIILLIKFAVRQNLGSPKRIGVCVNCGKFELVYWARVHLDISEIKPIIFKQNVFQAARNVIINVSH